MMRSTKFFLAFWLWASLPWAAFCELSASQKWVVQLTAIMALSNGTTLDTLEDEPITDESRKRWAGILERDWGIHNRDELLSMMKHMEVDGHAVELTKVQEIAKSTKDFSYFNVLNNLKLSQKQYNYLKYYLANVRLLEGKSILVWDLGRNIALCRWGYDCGYLSEDEAWKMMFDYARKIQPLYQSWKEFGFDYYMGRVFWASGFGSELDYAIKTDHIYRRLLAEGGIWSNNRWDVDLKMEG